MGLQNPQRRNNLFNFKNAWQGGLIGVFLLFALSSTFTGCKKDDVIETKSDKVITKSASAQSAPIPEIRNNRLYFPNQESLENFTNSLKELENHDEINARLKSAGFISYYYYENASDEEQNAIPVENREFNDMPDDILKTILNVNQEVQIDNVICRLQNEYGFIFEEKDRNLVSEFSNLRPQFDGDETGYKEQIIAFKLNVKENSESDIMHKSVSLGGYGWKTQNTINMYVSEHFRVRGHHWATNVFFYKSFGVATYHEKKIRTGFIIKSWNWRPWNAENIKLRLYGDATFRGWDHKGNTVTQTGITYSHLYNISNANKAVHTFDTRWQVGVKFGGKAGWTIPIVKFHIPFGITGVKTNFEIDLNVLDTEHEANWKKTNPLRWKW